MILNIQNAQNAIEEIIVCSEDMKFVINDNQVRINYIKTSIESLNLNKAFLTIRFKSIDEIREIQVDESSHFLGKDGSATVVDISIPKNSIEKPLSKLNSVYPNPMTEFAKISFDLAESSGLRTEVYTVYGQLVASIDQGNYTAGTSEILIKRKQLNLRSGTYIVRLIAQESNEIIGSRSIIIQ